MRYWREAVIAVMLLVVCVTAWAYLEEAEQRGVFQERARVADSTLSIVLPRLDKVDTLIVARIDTVRKLVTRVNLDTLTDTVFVKDSAGTHTTSGIVVPIPVFNDLKDLEKTCSALANACEQFKQDARTAMAAMQVKIDAAPKPMTTRDKIVWSVLGGVLGRASCSVK